MSGFSDKPIVIDASGHLTGRLAALVAKTLLAGQRVIVLRCECLVFSGIFFRNKLKYLSFLRKRCNVNPQRGPFHQRAPSKIFKRTVRGMLPSKTMRGRRALRLLKAYEGIPGIYQHTVRKVVPDALRKLRLAPGRKYCSVGRLSHEVGWKHQKIVKTMEMRRKIKDAVYKKKRRSELLLKAKAATKVAKAIEPFNKVIVSYGVDA
ncbi:60S ribosomal protein L13a [Penaeus vannamei]|uniref:Large ribosomal subunit protein uL13 n=1 Tax=Penaeus vannamei TaxID=6689 RepID=A0A3R7Q736_PENVA|nr:60S ribosomal protein L13a-like [Penaeus vannamei]ROT70187.1 60S ribosomal protein L13a [Penaeus vannamei]